MSRIVAAVCLGLWLMSACLTGAPASSGNEAKGDAAFQKQDYKKAAKEYKKAVDKEPNRPDLRYKLAEAYFKKGDMAEAMSEYIRVTNMDPNHVGANQRLGDFFTTKNELDKAAKAYENLVRIKPDSAEYHFQLAKVYDKQMRNDDALTHFYRTVQINPTIEDAYPFLFKLLQRKILQSMGDVDAQMMLGRVYKMHRDLADARTTFAGVVQAQPTNREGWEELLEVCRQLKDCTGEIAALEGLRTFAPKSVEIVDQIVATARRCEVDDVAIRYLEEKISLVPDDWASYAELGRLYRKADNRIQAYFFFRQYVEKCPSCPDVEEYHQWCRNEELANTAVDGQYRAFLLFRQGAAAFQGGNFLEAVRLLDQAQAIYGAFPQLHFIRGQALEELNRRGEALYAYKEAIKLQPANAEYWFFLGKALDAEQMREQAVVCFRKTLEVDPENRYGYGERAQKMLQSYMDQGIIKQDSILSKEPRRP
jgi:tetratricopeptide (TPR) repeat protein